MTRFKTGVVFLALGLVSGLMLAELVPWGQADPTWGGLVGQVAPSTKGRDPFSYRDVVKKVLPAVVYIEASSRSGAGRGRFGTYRAASGAIIDPSGIVVTNNHVVAGVDQVEVHLKDGRKFVSRMIATDEESDLAIIRIQSPTPLPYIELGDSDAVDIGDRVLAVGAPFGLAGSVTHGIISAKGRTLNLSPYENYLQTDAAINPGNSGGPLVNMDGQIIGINTAIKSQSGGFQGIGLAIPSNRVRAVVSQSAKEGKVRRGYLGIQMQDVDEQLAEKLNLGENRGVVVTQVRPSTPASKAGLRENDVITAVNGRGILNGKELQRFIFESEIGKVLELTVIRDGKPEKVKVAVEEQPEDYGLVGMERRGRTPGREEPAVEGVMIESVGLEVAQLTSDLAEQLGYRDARGLLITRVERGSLADTAGLRPGMVILRAEQQRVDTPEALKKIIERTSLQKGVLLAVRTPSGGTRLIILKSEV
ncbi:MAG: trypsin-like peptidase domain-containing protein [Gemmatales bacterium]|nr:trypsin-like peptidase domain-containing protein [Gemmatales bacterium]MDW8386599.1 trypsin-like peptidase domain-containing protein [Gemmatales bacterium]